jgi:hypothetical protein
MGLPYDYSLNHHQLLFILVTFICTTKMEIVFTKSKRKIYFWLYYFNNGSFSLVNTL